MEGLPPTPRTGDGLLFVLSGPQLENALRKNVAGMPFPRLHIMRSIVAGQPIFLFDSDARLLHGPYAAVGPGGTNLDSSPLGKALPAQLRFAAVVRAFQPLPESHVSDVLSFDPAVAGLTRQPSARVEASVVTQLLLLFVLNHHGLFDEGTDNGFEDESGEAPYEEHASRLVAVRLAAFLERREAEGHLILGTSLGEFYGSLGSPTEGEECRELVRRCAVAGCKRGLQSFVHKHGDLLCLVGEKLQLQIGVVSRAATYH